MNLTLVSLFVLMANVDLGAKADDPAHCTIVFPNDCIRHPYVATTEDSGECHDACAEVGYEDNSVWTPSTGECYCCTCQEERNKTTTTTTEPTTATDVETTTESGAEKITLAPLLLTLLLCFSSRL